LPERSTNEMTRASLAVASQLRTPEDDVTSGARYKMSLRWWRILLAIKLVVFGDGTRQSCRREAGCWDNNEWWQFFTSTCYYKYV